MKMFKNSLPAGLLVATAMMSAGTVQAADKYLESVEERLERVERELRIIQSDAKGKDIATPDIPIFVKPKSKYVEEVKLRGRLQWQAGYVMPTANTTGAAEENYSTMEIRRARIGIEAKLMNDFKAMVELNAVPNDAFLNEGYVQWTAYDYFQPLVGFVKPRFGYEENTSSANILTIERSLLTNTLASDQLIGAVVEGEYGMYNYSAGIFNNINRGANAGRQPFGGADNIDYAYNYSGGLDLSDVVGFTLKLRGDYVNASATPGAGNQFDFFHNVAGSVAMETGPFGLVLEGMAGISGNAPGAANSTIFGFYAMPSYYVIPKKLQLVARYTFVEGDDGATFQHEGRYARRAGPAFGAAGDLYNAVYGGMNYYINGNDLKLMLGVEWANLKVPTGVSARDTTGAVTLYTGVRMQF